MSKMSKQTRERRDETRKAMVNLRRREKAGKVLAETGQATKIVFFPQLGMFSPPARSVDAETRALIDRAVMTRGAGNARA